MGNTRDARLSRGRHAPRRADNERKATERAGSTQWPGTDTAPDAGRSTWRSIGIFIISISIGAALLPGIFNRIYDLYPTSDLAFWFGNFRTAHPGLGLEVLADLKPRRYNLGYWIGVTGTVVLTLLLFYSARKRLPKFRRWGGIAGWLRLHIVLGSLVPVLILYHCNFRFGATNSNVALISMLTVAISGVIGRFFFMRAHTGFQQQKATAEDMLSEILKTQRQLCDQVPEGRQLLDDLEAFNAKALPPRVGLLARFSTAILSAIKTRRAHRSLLARNLEIIQWMARTNAWRQATLSQWLQGTRGQYSRYFAAVRRAAWSAAYQRLLSFWDPLHLPLSIVMVLSTIAHVIVVHTY